MKKLAITLTALVLILALALTGLVWPGFLLGLSGGGSRPAEEQTAAAKPVVWKGSSKAFSITPIEGVTISAEKNAMDKDRSFEVREISEEAQQALVDEYCAEAGDDFLPLGGMEISAGLEPDELLPEGFTVQLDLAAWGVPEEMWDRVTALRRDDDGRYYEYVTWLDGGKLSFESQQNCAIEWVIAAGVIWYCGDELLPSIGTGISWGEMPNHIYVTETDNPNSKRIFKLKWTILSGEMVELQHRRDLKAQIEKEYTGEMAKKDILRERGLDPNKNTEYAFKKGEVAAYREKRIEQMIAEGSTPAAAAYREADEKATKMVREHLTPELVLNIAQRLRYAREYNKSLGVKLPKSCMTVELVPKITAADAAGVSVSPLLFLSSYIVLQTQGLLDNPAEFDALTTTAVHEYFHACTNCYKSQSRANLKINEATAQIVESDSVQWLLDRGYISSAPGSATRSESTLQMYGLPLNDYKAKYADGQSVKFSGSDRSDTGYPLCHLIRFLLKKIPKASRDGSEWHNVLSTYTKYRGTPSVTDFLKDCFGLSDEGLTNYFYLFARTYQARFYEKAKLSTDGFDYQTRWVYPVLNNGHDVSAHAELDDHDYTIRVRQLIANPAEDYDGDVSTLVVPDKDFSGKLPDTRLIPVGNTDCRMSKYGPFYSPVRLASEEFFSCYMMEVDGGLGTAGNKSGYSIYCVEAPETPEMRIEKNAVKFKLPEKSDVAKAGYIDGYRLSFKSEDGKLTELHYPIRDAEKEKSVPLGELVNKQPERGKTESVRLRVSICEYIEGKDGGNCYGPESDASVRGDLRDEERTENGKTGTDGSSGRDDGSGENVRGAWTLYHTNIEGERTYYDGWDSAFKHTFTASPGEYAHTWTCSMDYYSAGGTFLNREGDSSTVTCRNAAPPDKIKGGETVSLAVTLEGHYEKRSFGNSEDPSDYADGGDLRIVTSYGSGDYAFFHFGEDGETLYTSWEEPTASRVFTCEIRRGNKDGEEMTIRVDSLGMSCYYYYVWNE